jgi:hypothetical protein
MKHDIDPFAVLELPYLADETKIQQAFQKKLKEASDPELIIQAYGMIRDQTRRNHFCWEDVRYCLLDTENQIKQEPIDFSLLIQELAFLSPWEMGDDTCLN